MQRKQETSFQEYLHHRALEATKMVPLQITPPQQPLLVENMEVSVVKILVRWAIKEAALVNPTITTILIKINTVPRHCQMMKKRKVTRMAKRKVHLKKRKRQ